MSKLPLYLGAAVGSYAGWWLGSGVGMWVALLLSTVGGVAGVLLAYWLVRNFLE